MKFSKKSATVLKKAAELIKGKAAKGYWVKVKVGGETHQYNPLSRSDYNRMKKQLELARQESPNVLPVTCCTGGAIFIAAAQEGLTHAEAQAVYRQADEHVRETKPRVSSIPDWNDHRAPSKAAIENNLAEIAKVAGQDQRKTTVKETT